MKKVKFGIVGVGDFGVMHIQALKQLPGHEKNAHGNVFQYGATSTVLLYHKNWGGACHILIIFSGCNT